MTTQTDEQAAQAAREQEEKPEPEEQPNDDLPVLAMAAAIIFAFIMAFMRLPR